MFGFMIRKIHDGDSYEEFAIVHILKPGDKLPRYSGVWTVWKVTA